MDIRPNLLQLLLETCQFIPPICPDKIFGLIHYFEVLVISIRFQTKNIIRKKPDKVSETVDF